MSKFVISFKEKKEWKKKVKQITLVKLRNQIFKFRKVVLFKNKKEKK